MLSYRVQHRVGSILNYGEQNVFVSYHHPRLIQYVK